MLYGAIQHLIITFLLVSFIAQNTYVFYEEKQTLSKLYFICQFRLGSLS